MCRGSAWRSRRTACWETARPTAGPCPRTTSRASSPSSRRRAAPPGVPSAHERDAPPPPRSSRGAWAPGGDRRRWRRPCRARFPARARLRSDSDGRAPRTGSRPRPPPAARAPWSRRRCSSVRPRPVCRRAASRRLRASRAAARWSRRRGSRRATRSRRGGRSRLVRPRARHLRSRVPGCRGRRGRGRGGRRVATRSTRRCPRPEPVRAVARPVWLVIRPTRRPRTSSSESRSSTSAPTTTGPAARAGRSTSPEGEQAVNRASSDRLAAKPGPTPCAGRLRGWSIRYRARACVSVSGRAPAAARRGARAVPNVEMRRAAVKRPPPARRRWRPPIEVSPGA